MFYLYILKSIEKSTYYIGSCQNLSKRLTQHNKGKVRSTKRFRPWQLVYYKTYNNLSEARKRETQIKSWKKRSAIERLVAKQSAHRGSSIASGGPLAQLVERRICTAEVGSSNLPRSTRGYRDTAEVRILRVISKKIKERGLLASKNNLKKQYELGLAGESGEIAEKMKRVIREKNGTD